MQVGFGPSRDCQLPCERSLLLAARIDLAGRENNEAKFRDQFLVSDCRQWLYLTAELLPTPPYCQERREELFKMLVAPYLADVTVFSCILKKGRSLIELEPRVLHSVDSMRPVENLIFNEIHHF